MEKNGKNGLGNDDTLVFYATRDCFSWCSMWSTKGWLVVGGLFICDMSICFLEDDRRFLVGLEELVFVNEQFDNSISGERGSAEVQVYDAGSIGSFMLSHGSVSAGVSGSVIRLLG